MKYVRACKIPTGVGRAHTDAQHQTCSILGGARILFSFSYILSLSLSRSVSVADRDPVPIPFLLKKNRRRYEITQAE